jgi:DnaK suppressor protein
MGQFDAAEVRQRLTAERMRLQEDIFQRTQGTEAVTSTNPLSDSGGAPSDQVDEADMASASERNQAMLRNSQALLNQVDGALARLDAGTYGICRRCGKEINPRRLEALPYATLCVDCQAAVAH